MKNFAKMLFATLMLVIATNMVKAQSFNLWGASNPNINLISSDANDTICEGTMVSFSTPWEGSTTYQFFVDGVSMQGPAVGNSYSPPTFTDGNYEVVVIADNGTCQSSDTIDFVALAVPAPILTITDNSVCAGTTVVLTGTDSGPGGTYNFLRNGVSQQNTTSNTYTTSTYNNGDIFSLIVTNAGGCSASATPITMTVYALPVATVTTPDNSVCDGTSVTFTAGTGVNYNFFIGSSSMQNGALITYTNSSLNNGDVITVQVTDGNGCMATSVPITMTIHPIPHATSVTGNTPGTAVCPGSTTAVTITGLTGTGPWTLDVWNAVGGTPTTLLENAGTTNSPNTTIFITVPSTGLNNVFLEVTDSNGCSNN